MARTSPWRGIGCLLAAILVASPAIAVEPPPPEAARTLAVVPFYAPERMWLLYAPLVEHLRRVTGDDWRLSLPANHRELIDDLCAGKVDVALVGPVPLARANAQCGVAPFLVALGATGAPTYRSVLLTATPSVTSLAALRGKRIGFFRGSTAAHVVPARMLAEAGLGTGTYEPVFLESQDRLVAALLARKIAAAGVKSSLYARFEREPGLRALRTSGPLPNFSFVALPSLPPAVRDRFAAALLRLRPLERAADAKAVGGWDDEVRHGFAAPGADFLPSVLALRSATEEVLRDVR